MGQVHCIPIEESRHLHEDALRVREQEALLLKDAQHIKLLEEEKETIRKDMNTQLQLSEEKFRKQLEISIAQENKIEVLGTESKYYRDKYKKQKILGTFKVIGIALGAASVGYFVDNIL